MTFDWDPTKSEEDFVRRGFDFAFASMMFNASYVEYDTRRDYGERQIVALGRADSIPLTVMFTHPIAPDRAIVRRSISARVSNRKERRRYAQKIKAVQTKDPDPGSR